MNQILRIYEELLKTYGLQGWWPVNEEYHKENYNFPKNTREQFETTIGAILTQNTSWIQVEKALENLRKLKCLEPEKLLKLNKKILTEAIKPAGYFNQKAEYLITISKFFISLKGKTPTRKELLAVKGVGEETADSILLYAYRQTEFVVDGYTKRIFVNLRLIKEKASYKEIKKVFEDNLPKDIEIYQEYHALIVEHAKRYYKNKPYRDPLINKNLINH
ncbi:MAG: endonuclease III domain-containing protein [DPANN group archaeon]|nr:endonuclease III domain-containing protein [DPANN group archaeon]